MRRADLVRRLQRVPELPEPRPELEQVASPAEAAATLLASVERHDGLAGRSVLDLGCGTGRLSIGAAILGASPVAGLDADPRAIAVAVDAARAEGVSVDFSVGRVGETGAPAEIVVMNPPFGAQRRHADRPFWEAAFRLARRSVYAFSLAASRTFIARLMVVRHARVLEVVPVPWSLGRTFPHHRHRHVSLEVDLWAIRVSEEPDGP
jgi:putative methylase